MVRLKTRYILFEILYPERSVTSDSYSSRSKTILALHQPTQSSINARILVSLIRSSLSLNFGDIGAASAVSMSLKYFSNKTSTGIIRINRDNYRYIIGALTLIDEIGGEKVIVRCVSVSGSIKKCEDKSVEISKRMMKEV
ncbi:hypothetical protein CANARDRAFT_191358, partial [[Candida] arabinofermentans NRRL YB-2248]